MGRPTMLGSGGRKPMMHKHMSKEHPHHRAIVRTTPMIRGRTVLGRPYDPIREDLMTEFANWPGHWLPTFGGRWAPARTEVEDLGTSYEVRADFPGVRKEDIEVTLQGRTLSLEAKEITEKEEGGKVYLAREESSEDFCRLIDLPEDVVPDKISARYKDGVLTVTIPKSNPVPEKKIPIE